MGRRKRWTLGGFLVIMVGLLCAFHSTASAYADNSAHPPAYTPEEQALVAAYQDGSLIRLHVLAEDNTQEAQRIKLAVRDALLKAFQDLLSSADPDALYLALEEHREIMREVAEETARKMGFQGKITAEVGVLRLPAKRYGQVLLPEGPYRGLRVTLGKGQGQNWWCVLYPSLCLAVADDEPWTAPDSLTDEASQEPQIVWDTEKIMSQWMLWPR